MGSCTVNKFLCCFSLETGGLIVGWVNLIISTLALFGIITALSLTIVGYDAIETNPDQSFVGGFIILIITFITFILYYLIVFFASIFLIQGTSRRDHTKMVLFMTLMAIGVIIQFMQLFVTGWQIIFSALFFACLSAYFFICIYSLYSKIKNEKMGRAYA